jgi:hypothetical protein
MKLFKHILIIALCILIAFGIYKLSLKYLHENAILKQVISRLEADSRIAEILVTGVNYDENAKKTYTTIKFLEYDAKGRALEPRYFTFSGNIIQFQSLVIRFDDMYIRGQDRLRGKSAYLFWKVFMLDGKNTQEYVISKASEIPRGYKLDDQRDPFEERLWREFWGYALDPQSAKTAGIKNAQIEAPGTMFIPGIIYTVKIEHDGGLRIDSSPLSPILQGEKIFPFRQAI